MSFDTEALYGLLPAIYRVRDAQAAEALDDLLTSAEHAQLQALRAQLASGAGLDEIGQRDLAALEEKRLRGPLKALLTVDRRAGRGPRGEHRAALRRPVHRDRAPWAVPYIGDLVGFRPLDPELQARSAAIARRSRTRSASAAARARRPCSRSSRVTVTDWDAAVVEMFLRLAHDAVPQPPAPRPRRHGRPARTPTSSRRSGRRSIVPRTPPTCAGSRHARGRYNIPNVGIFLWRVGSQRLTDPTAFAIDDRRFTFNPLGANTQLFRAAERDTDATRLAGPVERPAADHPPRPARRPRRALRAGLSLSIEVGGDSCRCARGARRRRRVLRPVGRRGRSADRRGRTAARRRSPSTPCWVGIACPRGVAGPVRVTYPRWLAGRHRRRRVRARRGGPARAGAPRARATARRSARRWTTSPAPAPSRSPAAASFDETPVLRAAAERTARAAWRSDAAAGRCCALTGDLVVGGGDSGEVVLDGPARRRRPDRRPGAARRATQPPADAAPRPLHARPRRDAHARRRPGRDGAEPRGRGPDVRVEIEHAIVGATARRGGVDGA